MGRLRSNKWEDLAVGLTPSAALLFSQVGLLEQLPCLTHSHLSVHLSTLTPEDPEIEERSGAWCRHLPANPGSPGLPIRRKEAGGQVGGLKTSTHLFGLEDNKLCLRDEHVAGDGAWYISGIRESPSGEVASRLDPMLSAL